MGQLSQQKPMPRDPSPRPLEEHKAGSSGGGFKLPNLKPPEFSGRADGVETFLFKLDEIFAMDANARQSENDKVIFAGSYCKGGAPETWYKYVRNPETPEGERVTTWEQFKESLRLNFAALDTAQDARDRLHTAKQKQGTPVHEYTGYLRSLFMKVPGMAEDEKLDKYLRGLTDEIKKEVRMRKPETLEDAIKIAEDYDRLLRQIGKQTWKEGPRTPRMPFAPRPGRGFPPRGDSRGPAPMDLNAQDMRPKDPPKPILKRVSFSEKEKGPLHSEKEKEGCRICGSMKHWQRDCPEKHSGQGKGRPRQG
jgi:hypothetical protein